MKCEGLDPALINTSTSASNIVAPPVLPTNPLLEKYKKMLKAGVPMGAVKAKMHAEGKVDPELLDCPTRASDAGGSSIVASNLTDTNPLIEKYLKMIKAGVPRPAVEAKMRNEGLDPLLLDGTSTFTSSAKKSVSGEIISSGPKLLGLHWEPLADDKLQDSVWSNVNVDSGSLPTEELTGLVSMFERKHNKVNNKRASFRGNNEEDLGNSNKKKKSANPTHIDMSRSTNIAIGLASFKGRGLGPEQLSAAVDNFRIAVLSAEDLLRLQEMLPTDAEVKLLHDKSIIYEDLHESEKCLYKLSMVKGLKKKVQSMLFISTCSQTILQLGADLAVVREAYGQVLLSRGLQEVMRCILAIGNAMNQGTWKGGASGFRLSALSKLHQTKANDGKTTVLDYLIQLLYTRKDVKTDAMASAAINIDTELHILTRCKSVSITDLSNECTSMQRAYNEAMKIITELPSRTEVSERIQNVGPLETNNDKLLQGGMSVFHEIVEDEERAKLISNLQQIKVQVDTLASAIENAKIKALEMNKFFGEDQSLGHVGVVITLLADFVDAFAQSKSKFARIQKSREKEKEKERAKLVQKEHTCSVKAENNTSININENDNNFAGNNSNKQCYAEAAEKETLIL